ncbi:MAG: hypothetical protein M0C28_44720 [Candidatus Moduliflexus flocculans]|nr:hypothetical protein [Candidatus Moduliflexus flocculans]
MVELASSDQIFENPLHPYTEALLEAYSSYGCRQARINDS